MKIEKTLVRRERSDENEFVTQIEEKLENRAEIEEHVLDLVSQKPAGNDAVLTWRQINILQHAQCEYYYSLILNYYIF